jgi:tripartite-type tricarboxylate transporter receptor subunit TctC
MKRRDLLLAAAGAAALGLPLAARAQQAYPSRAITWVVGFPPGGGADGVTRLVAAKLSQNLGQPVIVENRPGASSIIAAQYVTQAAPDGYTIMMAEQGSLVFNTALYSKLPYDPKDLAPVSDMIRAPLILVVNPAFPAKDFKEFLEVVKQQPGKFNYGSPGRGIAHNLAMEALKARAGLSIVDIHYKGIAPAAQDLMAGQVAISAIDTVIVLPYLRSGKMRALATFSDKRLSVAPDVPSLAELGYPDMDIAPIVGVVAPRNTPKDIIAKLSAELQRAVRDPDVSAKLNGLGLEIIADTPEQFAAFLDAEGRRWLPFIRKLGIKLD